REQDVEVEIGQREESADGGVGHGQFLANRFNVNLPPMIGGGAGHVKAVSVRLWSASPEMPAILVCCLHLHCPSHAGRREMIRKLASGEYRLYSRKKDPRTGKRRNLGTFKTRAAA